MKILITGTFCAGKSTLSKALMFFSQNSILIEEPARELLTSIPNLNWSLREIRSYLIVRQIVLENIAEKNGKHIIVDAGVESNIAHDELLHPEIVNFDLPDILGHKIYDYVFFCDHTEIELESDGYRMTDSTFRILLATKIREVVGKLGYTPILVSGSVLERLIKIQNYVPEIFLPDFRNIYKHFLKT